MSALLHWATSRICLQPKLGGLHAEDDGQLALLDHLTGLRGVGDDPEPAFPGPPYILSM